jgi:2-oxo-4-hydroxy-4-carboxy-5-ureidoimidazoline decarboxylase
LSHVGQVGNLRRIGNPPTQKMTLSELNSYPQDQFTKALTTIFEHSPWIPNQAWPARPFATVESLHQAMIDEVHRAPQEQQLQLLRAHPDLGARARMSRESTGEQTRAGLTHLTADQLNHLRTQNDNYRAKFDFPFILAVKGATYDTIIQALNQRITRSREDELKEALRQVSKIARFRLNDLIKE